MTIIRENLAGKLPIKTSDVVIMCGGVIKRKLFGRKGI